MTTLNELCQDVYTLTGRPDLVADTQLALRAAARKFHLIDFWFRDHQEKALDLGTPNQNFSFDIPSNFTNWRKFSYIRPVDPIQGMPKDKYIKFQDPTAIFDEFGRSKTDVFYTAGTRINMKTLDSESAFLFGWYSFPNLGPSNFASWIADMYPELLVYAATGEILNVIGQVDEANKILDPAKGMIYNPESGMLKILRTNELEPQAR